MDCSIRYVYTLNLHILFRYICRVNVKLVVKRYLIHANKNKPKISKMNEFKGNRKIDKKARKKLKFYKFLFKIVVQYSFQCLFILLFSFLLCHMFSSGCVCKCSVNGIHV